MENLLILERKIKDLISKIKIFKTEKEKLLKGIELLSDENFKSKKILKENELLKGKIKKSLEKINQIFEILEKYRI